MSERETDGNDVISQASAWVVRTSSPDFSAADLDELNAWLEASDDHLQAYERAEALWLATAPPAPAQPRAAANDTAPRPTWKKAWTPLAAAAAVLVAAAGGYAVLAHRDRPLVTTYQTLKGQQKHVVLADGSALDLNTDTRLTVTLSHAARQFRLDRGEVLFAVVHDPGRPLTVEAGDTRIKDIGTRFVVYRAPTAVSITVLDGSVSATTGASSSPSSLTLTADQSVDAIDSAFGPITKIDGANGPAWLSHEVSYKDQSLETVVGDLNRYFDKPIVVDASARRLKLTAAVNLDSESLVVKRLEAFLPITATTAPDHILLRRR